MNFIIQQELAIEEAIAFIAPHLSVLPPEPKPTLLHCIRIGMYLYQHGYDTDLVIAGFLHDMIEDTEITYEDISFKRGIIVADIVLANTRDQSLSKSDRKTDLIRRCKKSKNASLIKALDILDGLQHYVATNNTIEIPKKLEHAKLLLTDLSYSDPLFDELQTLVSSLS